MYMKSSMFTLWLITGVLSYANRIPVISRLIKLLGLWYGRTTIWRLLVLLRKIFITVNAAIGVYIMFSAVGFSTDNLLAGIWTLSHNYLEAIGNLARKLFYWIFDLLDMKVVPNVPKGPSNYPSVFNKNIHNPINGWGWYTKPMGGNISGSLLDLANNSSDLLKNPFNININVDPTPWYKNYMTWVYLAGAVGLLYCGYKFVTEPLWVLDVFKKAPTADISKTSPGGTTTLIPPVQPEAGPSRLGAAGQQLNDFSKKVGSTVINVYSQVTHALNPFNWLANNIEAKERAAETFMHNQKDIINYNNKLYPFTPVNPYAPWYERIRMLILGETSSEMTNRLAFKNKILNSHFTSIGLNDGRTLGSLTPVTNVGIGISTPTTPGFVETVLSRNNEVLATILPSVDTTTTAWTENVVDSNAIQEYAESVANRMAKGAPLTDSALAGRVAGLNELGTPGFERFVSEGGVSSASAATTLPPIPEDVTDDFLFQ